MKNLYKFTEYLNINNLRNHAITIYEYVSKYERPVKNLKEFNNFLKLDKPTINELYCLYYGFEQFLPENININDEQSINITISLENVINELNSFLNHDKTIIDTTNEVNSLLSDALAFLSNQ